LTTNKQALTTLVESEVRSNHQRRLDLRLRVLELMGERFTDGSDEASLELAIRVMVALYTGEAVAKGNGKPRGILPDQRTQPAKRKRGKLSFNLNRGRHFVTCLVCGKTFSQRIPDQANWEYRYNVGNPFIGLCILHDKEQGVSDVKLRYSLTADRVLAYDPNPTDYNLLEGEWLDLFRVAYLYSKKVAYEERADLLHDIILALAKRRLKDGSKIPDLRAYKIASLEVALYWKRLKSREQKCCIYTGEPKACYPKSCKRSKGGKCEWQATRPILSLDQDRLDDEGYITQLRNTVADDKAIDIPQWLEIKTFLLGCPFRVIELANRKRTGQRLKQFEMNYLTRWRKQAQLTMFPND